MMSEYLKLKSENCVVKHIHSGKNHIFKVHGDTDDYDVIVQVHCSCRYMGVQGVANGRMCSHVLATLRHIIENGEINFNNSDDTLWKKRMQALNLLRVGSRKVNQVRVGDNESKDHQKTKENICSFLKKEGKHFVTEAIFESGGRADIFVLDDFLVIEILKSEAYRSVAENKKDLYPSGVKFEVIMIGDGHV